MQCSRNCWWFGSVSVELFISSFGGRGDGWVGDKNNSVSLADGWD